MQASRTNLNGFRSHRRSFNEEVWSHHSSQRSVSGSLPRQDHSFAGRKRSGQVNSDEDSIGNADPE
jgi:hypothetical protein